MLPAESITAATLRSERDRCSNQLREASHQRATAAKNVITAEASLEAAKLLYGDAGQRIERIIAQMEELRAAYRQLTGAEMPVN